MKINFNKYDRKMKNILDRLDCFECEICKCLTPKKCEGTEPNTCEMCMPKKLPEISTKNY